jgi:hypothetical protein
MELKKMFDFCKETGLPAWKLHRNLHWFKVRVKKGHKKPQIVVCPENYEAAKKLILKTETRPKLPRITIDEFAYTYGVPKEILEVYIDSFLTEYEGEERLMATTANNIRRANELIESIRNNSHKKFQRKSLLNQNKETIIAKN